MFKTLASGLLIFSFLFSISAADNGLSRCNCDEEGFWSTDNILECQKVSDFLIAVAYFSIPVELLYFVSFSNVPFKLVLFQFIAFIVLCGMTHLLNGWTYGPHSFQMMLALTIFKFLTALVSFATAITLFTLIPLLLKVKVREFMLKKKTWDLGREVGMIRKQKEAAWHVRMLTHEIRKSLDRHTILYTTLVELSKALDLWNCAIWKPNENRTEMNLTYELKQRNFQNFPIRTSDPVVRAIKDSDQVIILDPESTLATSSTEGGGGDDDGEPGAVAAIRMPILRVCNFKGGTPERIQACYDILVVVLPGGHGRSWSNQELEIVKVVADQVAVALSHAAVLQESQIMREKLVEQNRALQQARKDAMMASQARNAFQIVMSSGLRIPMHSILGLLSIMQDKNFTSEQQLLVDAMVKTSNVLSTLINDVMENSTEDNGRFSPEMRSFLLHSMMKEVACVAKCLCAFKGCSFALDVVKSLPNHVMGDERRTFQVILHMVGNLLNGCNRGGCLTIHVFSESGSQGRNDHRRGAWRSSSSDGYVHIKFEIGINNIASQIGSSTSTALVSDQAYHGKVEEGLSFSICKKLVWLMQGNIYLAASPDGYGQKMALVLRFQLRSSIVMGISESGESSDCPHSNSLFRGLQVLLADADNVNRTVTRKQLEKLGCVVSTVLSGYECLDALGHAVSAFQIVLLDLHLPDLGGFDVAARIKKFRNSSWPLVIGLTVSDDEAIWERCLQTGINGIVRKPAVLQGIYDELQRVIMQANRVAR